MSVPALEPSRPMKALISPCLLLMISSDMINYLLWQIGAYWDIMKNIEAYWNILKELVRLSIHRRVCAAHGGQPSSRERAAAGGPAGCADGCGRLRARLYVTLRYNSWQFVTLRQVMIHYDLLQFVTTRYTSMQFVTLRPVTIRYDSLRFVTLRYTSLHFVTIC